MPIESVVRTPWYVEGIQELWERSSGSLKSTPGVLTREHPPVAASHDSYLALVASSATIGRRQQHREQGLVALVSGHRLTGRVDTESAAC